MEVSSSTGLSVQPALPCCPRCKAIQLRRNSRSGFLQTKVYPRLGYFPWECGQCRQTYLLKRRTRGEAQGVALGRPVYPH